MATVLGTDGGDRERRALEALAAEEYRAGRLTKPQLRGALGFECLDEFDGFLKAHGVYEDYTVADIEREVEDVLRLGF
jgi:hypothetical protein